MPTCKKAFSLVALLVAFGILAIIVAVVVPRYTGMQYGTNLRVAEQQVDAVRKAVLSWSSSQPSLSEVSKAYGTTTEISEDAWNIITSEYLDPSFSSRINAVRSSGTVTFFTTNEMSNVTGNAEPTDQKYNNAAINVPAVSSPPMVNRKYTAYGVIYWPTSTATRRSSTPAVVLFAPAP